MMVARVKFVDGQERLVKAAKRLKLQSVQEYGVQRTSSDGKVAVKVEVGLFVSQSSVPAVQHVPAISVVGRANSELRAASIST